jgi:hypothetical protein
MIWAQYYEIGVCCFSVEEEQRLISDSNLSSFFRFENKRAIDLDVKISLAHARCTHLSQVIKSQNKIIYTVVKVLNIYIHWK